MCVVSMVADHFQDKWKQWPYNPQSTVPSPTNPPFPNPPSVEEWAKLLKPPPTRIEFDSLKKEVEEMKELLKRALEYDKKNNEPHCEMDEKVALLKAVAKMVGVDLEEIFGKDKGKETIY